MEKTINKYISDTLSDICTIKNFLEEQEKWFPLREAEINYMIDIIERKDKISLTLGHIWHSKKKVKAIDEYVWSGLTSMTAGKRRQKLEKELDALLKDTLEWLEKMQPFLEAVEKLAVTSPFMFADTRYLPKGMNANDVRSVIFAARKTSPLLVHFKRDDKSFFLSDLNNLEVLLCQLITYIQISNQLCMNLEERKKNISSVARIWSVLHYDGAIKFNEDTHGESIEKMRSHINQLNMIRDDQDVRLTFLFQKSTLSFISLFNQLHRRMLQFLSDLEESARQLDNMTFGANISNVAGSSVGVLGGALSIAGLALAPVTAGVSVGLTIAGGSCGVLSGANSLVTTVTEVGVNWTRGNTAQKKLKCFMEDVQKLASCLETVANSEGPGIAVDLNVPLKAVKALGKAIGIGKGIDGLVDRVSAVKVLQTGGAAKTAQLGLQEAKAVRDIPKLASDLPDVGQLANGPLGMSKATRSLFVAANAVFIGLDIINICSGSINLSKGSKNEMAKLIRSKTALWRSELDSWEKMNDSLCRGFSEFSSSQEILEQPFYPH